MRATRRRFLHLPVLAAVAGCTPDPTVHGTPGDAPAPTPATRSDEAEAVATWVSGFADAVGGVAASSTNWGADETQVQWLAALQSQCAAHLSRVDTADPVIGGPTVFPAPSAPASAAPSPETVEEALAAVAAGVADGLPVLRAAIASDTDGAARLFHASMATAATGSLNPARPPVEGGAEPSPFPDPDPATALDMALTYVWVLIRGLELGLGRLPRESDLQESGRLRLDSAKTLRNELLAALTGDPPEVDTWNLPNAMSTTDEIRTAWAELEVGVLDALGVLVASGEPEWAAWLDAMLAQVPWVHQWGGRLPHWPGWVATP